MTLRRLARRQTLSLLGGGALSALLLPGSTAAWPLSERPQGNARRFLTAATRRGGGHGGALLGADGRILAEFPLPGRGHGAAVRPRSREAVIFARRPGDFALVLDAVNGQPRRLIPARDGRHFYGHGCYAADGALLFATENDFEGERGVIGIYDARNDYARVGEFPSHGLGPHEMLLMPDGRTLAVANGGILTHPDAPRMKLNLSEMESSVALIDIKSGELRARYSPPKELHQLSLRHLDVNAQGRIVVVAQWEGAKLEQPPLVALIDRDAGLNLKSAGAEIAARMRNYCGSVAFSRDGARFAVSAPRGGMITIWSSDGRYLRAVELEDGCGLAESGEGFIFTSGQGQILDAGPSELRTHETIAFDNHLLALR